MSETLIRLCQHFYCQKLGDEDLQKITCRVMLMRKVHGQQLATLMLSASEYFVLDLMVQNMESRQMELVRAKYFFHRKLLVLEKLS